MFLKLTRTDLKELFPDDFPTRKSLWDLLSSIVSLYYDGIQTSFFFIVFQSTGEADLSNTKMFWVLFGVLPF